MKLFKLLIVSALVFAVAQIAYAETQSVKISGDMAVRGLIRDNFDLNNDSGPSAAAVAAVAGGAQSTQTSTYLMSTTEVQVDADLTDNVGAVIRLVNQRQWGDTRYTNDATASGELGIVGAPFADQVAARAVAPGADAFQMDVDLAYVELKEFLYSPLTLKIGRQDLWFGKGFIVGAQQQDNTGALYAREYTAVNSFDAIRATLDYAPWTIDAVYSKIQENQMQADDDLNLYGINIGYVFDEYNAEAEAYWWFKQHRYTGSGTGAAATLTNVSNETNSSDVHTLGLRGSFDPIEDWTMALEVAYQGGQYVGVALQAHERARSAFALDAAVETRYWQDNFAWRPVFGLEYIYYSGEDNIGQIPNDVGANGTYNGWDSVFRGKFDSAIREFQNVYYRTATPSSPATTNEHEVLLNIKVEPTDSLTVKGTYGHFWLAEAFSTVTNSGVNENTDKDIGDEVDLVFTWDYTEDVSFGLLTGWFFPGSHFSSGQDDLATDVVGTVSLSF